MACWRGATQGAAQKIIWNGDICAISFNRSFAHHLSDIITSPLGSVNLGGVAVLSLVCVSVNLGEVAVLSLVCVCVSEP